MYRDQSSGICLENTVKTDLALSDLSTRDSQTSLTNPPARGAGGDPGGCQFIALADAAKHVGSPNLLLL